MILQPEYQLYTDSMVFYTINNQFLPQNLIPKFTKQQQQLHVKFNFRIAYRKIREW